MAIALNTRKDTVNGFLDCPIVAVETKDEFFEGLRNTKLSDTESWKRLIQVTAADDRAYLKDVQKLLQEFSQETDARSAFIYNFRSKACLYYDLGHAL